MPRILAALALALLFHSPAEATMMGFEPSYGQMSPSWHMAPHRYEHSTDQGGWDEGCLPKLGVAEYDMKPSFYPLLLKLAGHWSSDNQQSGWGHHFPNWGNREVLFKVPSDGYQHGGDYCFDPVPEPGTAMLLGAGLVALATRRRESSAGDRV